MGFVLMLHACVSMLKHAPISINMHQVNIQQRDAENKDVMDFMHVCVQVTLLKGSGVNWWNCNPGWNSSFSGWEDWIGMKLCWVNMCIFASKHKQPALDTCFQT